MYILTVEDTFSSAHQLRGYRGKCENIHGHNWKVVLSVKGVKIDKTGLLVDFNILKEILKQVTGVLDHRSLNDIVPFSEINPSSENIACYISKEVDRLLAERDISVVSVHSVTVWESETSRCTYIS